MELHNDVVKGTMEMPESVSDLYQSVSCFKSSKMSGRRGNGAAVFSTTSTEGSDRPHYNRQDHNKDGRKTGGEKLRSPEN